MSTLLTVALNKHLLAVKANAKVSSEGCQSTRHKVNLSQLSYMQNFEKKNDN